MRKQLYRIDWLTSLCMAIFAITSLVCIYSSTVDTPAIHILYKQAWGIGIGVIIYGICSLIPEHHMRYLGVYGFYITLTLLALTAVRGTVGMGAQRWLYIAGLRFQPAEVMKFVMPFFIVHYLNEHDTVHTSHRITAFLPIMAIIAGCCFLVLKQPDLGTATLLLCAATLQLWCAGMPTRIFWYVVLALGLSGPLVWYTLKPYQQRRILVFLGAGSPHNERYHVEQSKIAIGSGGLWGKGWQHGTQNQLRFLPERRTDFIFSVLCEEFGFIGALSIILVYVILFARVISSLPIIISVMPKLLIIGLVLPQALSVIINIGMVMGLVPVVGIPLPLISYGLSHLWTTCATFGSINSIIAKWMYR